MSNYSMIQFKIDNSYRNIWLIIKGIEHVPNIFMSFDKYLFLEVINILI